VKRAQQAVEEAPAEFLRLQALAALEDAVKKCNEVRRFRSAVRVPAWLFRRPLCSFGVCVFLYASVCVGVGGGWVGGGGPFRVVCLCSLRVFNTHCMRTPPCLLACLPHGVLAWWVRGGWQENEMINSAVEAQYRRHVGIVEERVTVATRVRAREAALVMECEQVRRCGGIRTCTCFAPSAGG
jgi:hypothetical protein